MFHVKQFQMILSDHHTAKCGKDVDIPVKYPEEVNIAQFDFNRD